MKQLNSFGIQFIARAGKTDKKQALLYVRITVNSQRTEMSLKKAIDKGTWNQSKETVKSGRDAKSTNSYIEQVRFRLTECYRQLQLDKQELSPEAIKNSFLGIEPEKEEERTLGMLMQYHNKHMGAILEWGTMKNYYTTEKYVKRFLQHKYRKDDLALSKLNFQFITEFELFLRQYKSKKQEAVLGNNGTMKHLERLKKIARLGVKMQWLTIHPFESFELKFQKVDRDFLTEEELLTIEEKEFSNNRLQLVKDLFVFSCYTGLAYSDVMNLSPSSISLGIDGNKWIRTNRQKTDIPVHIPLLPKAVEIIEKYSHNISTKSTGILFPGISNQNLNTCLKGLADLCGINKNLSFHLARHTFATSITLSNGVPMETVSKMLGHTKISTTQIYARVLERKISEDMRLLRQKLANKNERQNKEAI
ncbi:MAG TPA: site-specific integrase [Chitinophagaceae bacterium]|nr:site-specific integrase [Chitinophagaceae bacterium]